MRWNQRARLVWMAIVAVLGCGGVVVVECRDGALLWVCVGGGGERGMFWAFLCVCVWRFRIWC